MPDSSRDQRIGFIGAGNIGNPMARNLIDAGHQLVIFDLRPEVMENLLELGAEPAESCAESPQDAPSPSVHYRDHPRSRRRSPAPTGFSQAHRRAMFTST